MTGSRIMELENTSEKTDDVAGQLKKFSNAGFLSAIKKGHLDIAEEWLLAGADIHAVDEEGKSALHYAVQNNDTNAAKFLLERLVKS